MLRRSLSAALTCLFLVPAAVPAPAWGPAARETKAPRWDARGVGPPGASAAALQGAVRPGGPTPSRPAAAPGCGRARAATAPPGGARAASRGHTWRSAPTCSGVSARSALANSASERRSS